MKHWLIGLALSALPLLGISPASAGPVNADGTIYEFAFGGVGSALGDCSACDATVPSSTNAGDGPWTFSLAGPGVLTALDLFDSGDQFEIFDGGSSLGLTSAVVGGVNVGGDIAAALADLSFSRGLFYLAAGNHSITGTQVAGIGGAGVFWIEAIPVPAGLLLMLTGAAALGGLAARRKQKL